MQENLIQIDFSQIESLDPCIQGGYKIIFNQEIPFMIKFPDQEDQSIVETIRVRIMILVLKILNYQKRVVAKTYSNQLQSCQVRMIYFSIIVDIIIFQSFYHFQLINEFNYIFTQLIKTIFKLLKQIKSSIQISLGIQKYALKHSRDVNQNNSSKQIDYIWQQNARAQVSIIQTLEYKELTLITFEMIAGDEEIIKQHVYYKHGAVKSKFQIHSIKFKFILQ